MEPLKRRPEDESRAPRMAPAAYRAQRFVVKRAWSLLVLIVLSEVGAFLAKHYWDPKYEDLGRQGMYFLLLVVGLVSFWLWPRRAKFMRQLVGLLLLLGFLVLGTCLFLAANEHGWTLGAAWKHRGEYALTESGERWLFSGLGLALVMGLGLVVRQRIRAKHRTRKGQTWTEVDRPAPKSPKRGIVTEDNIGEPPPPTKIDVARPGKPIQVEEESTSREPAPSPPRPESDGPAKPADPSA